MKKSENIVLDSCYKKSKTIEKIFKNYFKRGNK